MSEINNLLEVIRKDWELIPNISKALGLFSALGVWAVTRAWQTQKSENIFIFSILVFNFLVLIFLKLTKPYLLRKQYPFSGFVSKDLETIQDGNLLFIVDHKKKKIRWIANMTTSIELGFRYPRRHNLEKDQSIFEYLEGREPINYKASRHILISGRPGD